MKLIVFSDSHGKTEDMIKAINKHRHEVYAVIHLGDCIKDADALSGAFPVMPICTVSGNCDGFFFSSLCDTEKLIHFEDVGIFICHGHSCSVNYSRDPLAYKAKSKGAILALYGHTHVARKEDIAGVTVFNPGSITCPRSAEPPSYGIIEVSGGKLVSAEVCYVE